MANFISEACVETSDAPRYIKRLCKHFAHKIDTTHTGDRGRAVFPFGTCEMTADLDTLVLRAEADDDAALKQVQNVIARHLKMFAKGRETLDVT